MSEIVRVNAEARQIVECMKGEFERILQKPTLVKRYSRVLITAMSKNQALVDALLDKRNRPSVLSAFIRCAEMGLEPDGRRAVINCYQKGSTGTYDVTLIPMYQGLAELAMRSGLISNIHCDKVCENDDFSWENGEIKHKIDFHKSRGAAYAFYCIVKFKDGSIKTETMSLEEVNEIRDRSTAYQSAKKYGKTCPWNTDYSEMAKKSVFRRCSKWLPLSPEQRVAIEADDDYSATAASFKQTTEDKFAQAMGMGDAPAESGETIDVAVAVEENTDTAPASDSLFEKQ